jgi:hypothetical protein
MKHGYRKEKWIYRKLVHDTGFNSDYLLLSFCGYGYSIWRAVAIPTFVPKKWLTMRKAKSIPAETPAEVNMGSVKVNKTS